MRPVRPEIKYTIAEKTFRTELEKKALPMLCLQSPAAHRLTVSCPIGKDGGRAKETPCRNWSTQGFATKQKVCSNYAFLWSELYGTF